MALTPNSPNADNSMQALKQYGSYIVTAILLALAAYFGWTYWQDNHARVDTVAADQYADIQQLNEEVNLASQNPDLETEAQEALAKSRTQLDKDIDTLVSTHGESVYAWQALMIKARQQVDSDDFSAATETFKQALAIDLGDAGLEAITRLRYAKTLLAAGDADAALAQANNDMPSSFEASQQELLGDIYLAQDNKDSAIKSYTNAWELLRSRQETRAVLALKMESLGITAEPIAEQTSLIQVPSVAAQPLAVDSSNDATVEAGQ
ncbi:MULTISPECIES: tetratricopeptide repeat protein [unclassified Psychrobacter]|uniref:YfgM family protein n=1 Tax=unclassified Psychrobacter TaxID=196806 RepID=UPI0025B2CA34|nr:MULTISPECIES: tetratricopeptide repeat protein [unclassified Psychrobacter]MDN3453853.1 tetratricopeptide repeat protein [Psychrobacter sp. APC 3350]MDN3501312.1 tetratricopeptide repeat protein [Psychrobacter sp. 5A.1]